MSPLLLTIVLMGTCVVIATPLGVGLAIALTLTGQTPVGRWVRATGIGLLFVLICLPMYIHASAWEATAGKYGWIPLMQTTANRFWFTGLVATSWVHGVSGAAWVALASLWGFSRVPTTILQQAALETGPFRRLLSIGVPYAWPATLAGTLWVALLAATEMTVADLYGVRTLADEVYLKYAFDPQPLPIVLACLLPLLVAVPLLWALQRTRGVAGEPSRTSLESGGDAWEVAGFTQGADSLGRWFATLLATILLLGLVSVPLLSLFVKAGLLVDPAGQTAGAARYSWSASRVWKTIGDALETFGPEFGWTAILAMAVAAVAVILGTVAATWAEGSPRRARAGFLLALAWVLVPGPVVGMAVLQLFHNRGPLLGELYQRTILPTVLALLPRAVPAAYLVMRAGYRMLARQPGEAARCDGASAWRRLLWIDLPRLKTALLVAAFTAGVVATADVPATLVVLPPGISTVGTRLFGLLHSGVRYQAAGLTISFSLIIGVMVMVAHRFSKRNRSGRVR